MNPAPDTQTAQRHHVPEGAPGVILPSARGGAIPQALWRPGELPVPASGQSLTTGPVHHLPALSAATPTAGAGAEATTATAVTAAVARAVAASATTAGAARRAPGFETL